MSEEHYSKPSVPNPKNQQSHALEAEDHYALPWGQRVIVVCTNPHCRCAQCCPTKSPLARYASDRAQDADTITWVILCMGGFVLFLVVLSFMQFAVDDSEHSDHVHHTHPVGWH